MRRARADDFFTWEPFDHGRRRRMVALVAVGICAGLAGLVIGRASSGGHGPLLPSAVATKSQVPVGIAASSPVVVANPATEQQTSRPSNKQFPSTPEAVPLPALPERQTLPAPVPLRQNDQAFPPASPPVVLLNPGSAQNNADVGEREGPEQARGASAPKREKKNYQEVPAQAPPRVVQRPVPSNAEEARRPLRQQNETHRSPLTDARPAPKSPVFGSDRPATFADYGELRDHMMRR